MGTVASTNAGIANLMQTLTNAGSSLVSSPLATPALQTALQNASPGDIVELSDAALQLQQTDAMFGISNNTSDSTDPLSTLLSSVLGTPASGTPGTTSATPASSADQLSAAQAAIEAQQIAALFGAGTGTVEAK